MLNDQLGGARLPAVAMPNKLIAVARKDEMTPPDAIILSKYELWCGYVNGDPSTEQGGVEIDVLNDWRKTQLYYHPLKMYADPDPTNLAHICKAIEIFGGVYIGIQLPVSAQGSTIWDVSNGPDADPGILGWPCRVRSEISHGSGSIVFTCISWGELIDITQAFWLYNDSNADHTSTKFTRLWRRNSRT